MVSSVHVIFFGLVALGGVLAMDSGNRYMSDKLALQKMFRCPPCEYELCPVLPDEGCEAVLEPGICGCCPVCARGLGQTCGLKMGRCGQGLVCRPRSDDPSPMAALLMGRAICTPVDMQFYSGLP